MVSVLIKTATITWREGLEPNICHRIDHSWTYKICSLWSYYMSTLGIFNKLQLLATDDIETEMMECWMFWKCELLASTSGRNWIRSLIGILIYSSQDLCIISYCPSLIFFSILLSSLLLLFILFSFPFLLCEGPRVFIIVVVPSPCS